MFWIRKIPVGFIFWVKWWTVQKKRKTSKSNVKKRNITTPNIKNEDMETEGTKLWTEEYLFIRSHKRIIHFSTLIFSWNFLFHSYFLVIPTLFLGTFLSVFPLLPSFFLFFYLSTLLSFFLFFVSCISFFILSILTVFSLFLLSSLHPYFLLSVLTLFSPSLLSFPILL